MLLHSWQQVRFKIIHSKNQDTFETLRKWQNELWGSIFACFALFSGLFQVLQQPRCVFCLFRLFPLKHHRQSNIFVFTHTKRQSLLSVKATWTGPIASKNASYWSRKHFVVCNLYSDDHFPVGKKQFERTLISFRLKVLRKNKPDPFLFQGWERKQLNRLTEKRNISDFPRFVENERLEKLSNFVCQVKRTAPKASHPTHACPVSMIEKAFQNRQNRDQPHTKFWSTSKTSKYIVFPTTADPTWKQLYKVKCGAQKFEHFVQNRCIKRDLATVYGILKVWTEIRYAHMTSRAHHIQLHWNRLRLHQGRNHSPLVYWAHKLTRSLLLPI